MNLYQKLVEIRKEIVYAQKTSKGYDFQYANESQILGAIRPKMDELGVFLEMEMVHLEDVTCTTYTKLKGKFVIEGLRATFEFKWVNADKPEETIIKKIIVQEEESDIKCVGSLMTYAHRYFLYKFFSVPTDKDDPDAFEKSQKRLFAKNEETEVEKVAEPPKLMSAEQANNILELLEGDLVLLNNILTGYKVSSLNHLPAKSYDSIVRRLNAKKAEAKE